ncbi:MAG: cation:dicarboxylase symporter family transporter, partial [Eubacterium sp.]|nr:cation:dicarboxylase symporter family transporter [Eubacterium sp.]
MAAKLQRTTEKFFLSAVEIDRISQCTAELLQQAEVKSKDILRFRLSIENVMEIWLRELGEKTECAFSSGTKFGRAYILLSAEGKKVNPNEYQDELMAGISEGSSILATLGLTLEYHYESGQNILKLTLPKGQAGQLMPVLLCMMLGALLGGIFEFVLPEAGTVVQEWVVTPVFDTLMNLLSVIAGPMIFLAVYSGIYGIGDTITFGKIGKHLIVRFLLMTFVFLLLAAGLILWFFPVSFGGVHVEGNSMMELYQMVLSIIPADIITPFQSGNA